MPKVKAFRSGYAKDVMPSRVEAEEQAGLAVPVASENGAQAGIVSPTLRIYGKANYKAVTLREAEMNMAKRTRGEMPPIKGGLDDDDTMKFPESKRGQNKITVGRPGFDPLGEVPDPQPGDLTAEEQALGREQQMVVGRVVPLVQDPGVVTSAGPLQTFVTETPEQIYLRQRGRVTLEMNDGTMSVACIDVKESQYGITILLPLATEGATFIPKPGSEITVASGSNRWKCYFPGTYFELPELSLIGLVFVKAEEK